MPNHLVIEQTNRMPIGRKPSELTLRWRGCIGFRARGEEGPMHEAKLDAPIAHVRGRRAEPKRTHSWTLGERGGRGEGEARGGGGGGCEGC